MIGTNQRLGEKLSEHRLVFVTHINPETGEEELPAMPEYENPMTFIAVLRDEKGVSQETHAGERHVSALRKAFQWCDEIDEDSDDGRAGWNVEVHQMVKLGHFRPERHTVYKDA